MTGSAGGAAPTTLRERAHELLEADEGGLALARTIRRVLITLILASVGAFILDSVPSIHARIGWLLRLVEHACVWIFTAEYAMRVWSCVEDRTGRYEEPLRGRLRYVTTPMAVIDLLAILPYWMGMLVPLDLVALRAVRLFRLAKLARYSLAFDTLEIVIINERRSLLTVFGIMMVAITVAAALMYEVEHEAQPESFGSVPEAMWWAVVTITTLGYGDVVPITVAGRIVAGLTAIMGIGMLALPTAIIGAGFVNELQKRNFAATATMVARVPLFSHLGPPQLAELTALLRPRELPPRYTIIRKNEHGHVMYFIDSGEVVVRSRAGRAVLGPGAFFGELALLEGRPRTATVVTLTGCRLLELSANDLHRVLANDPILRRALHEEADRRRKLLDGETEGTPAA